MDELTLPAVRRACSEALRHAVIEVQTKVHLGRKMDTVDPVEPPLSRKRSPLGAMLYWARDLLLSVIIAIIVILFLYQPVKVEGTSMMPSLVDQERIFINKFIYRLGITDISRGDTVVFW